MVYELYDDAYGELKTGSLASRIYFLLLQKPRTVSELSQILYSGKIQLSNIIRIIDKLEKIDYIEKFDKPRHEIREEGGDIRKKYWKASYKPILDYAEFAVKERKKGSPSPDREDLTKEDRKLLQLILESKWFSKFYDGTFLETQWGEVNERTDTGEYISSVPIKFFAFMLEELFSIRIAMRPVLKKYGTVEDILKVGSFDEYVRMNQSKLSDEEKERIDYTASVAKKSLGNYPRTNMSIDYYIKDYGFVFIPDDFALKLISIGRVALTIFLHFQAAARIKRRKKKKINVHS
jgi:hypothetical protein